MRQTWISAALCAASLVLAGCSDAIIGDWEAVDKNDCGKRSSFEVDDDLKVSGTIWIEDAVNLVCLECDFEGEVENLGDDEYEADIKFDTCACNGDRKATAECTLDDDKLDCELDFGACGTVDDEFEKQD